MSAAKDFQKYLLGMAEFCREKEAEIDIGNDPAAHNYWYASAHSFEIAEGAMLTYFSKEELQIVGDDVIGGK